MTPARPHPDAPRATPPAGQPNVGAIADLAHGQRPLTRRRPAWPGRFAALLALLALLAPLAGPAHAAADEEPAAERPDRNPPEALADADADAEADADADARADAAEAADEPDAAPEARDRGGDRPARGERLRRLIAERRERMAERGGNAGPPRLGDGDAPDAGRGLPPLDEARRDAALAVLADVHPKLAERLERAREANPRRAEWALRKMWPRLHRLVELREDDPELYKLRVADQRHKVETLRLVYKLRAARADDPDAESIETLEAELRRRVAAHFDVRQRIRRHELQRLAERIDHLRAELEERRSNRDALIGQYINALVDRRPAPDAPTPDLDASGDGSPDADE